MSKTSITRFIAIFAIALTIVFTSSSSKVQGQAERRVECGDVIESEFSKDFESHFYLLKMEPRDSFSVSIDPVGDLLQNAIALYGPTGISLGVSSGGWMSQSPSITSGRLSARGDYKIQVANTGLYEDGSHNGQKGGPGIYTLHIECEQIRPTPLSPAPSATISSTGSVAQTSDLSKEDLPPIFEVNKTYEIVLPSSTYIMKVINLRSDGWVQVEYNNKVSWLNSNQVVLVTLIED